MKNLPSSIKQLCKEGIWSIYKLKTNKYILITGRGYSCCNNHPQKFFELDEDGNIVKELDSYNSDEIESVVYL